MHPDYAILIRLVVAALLGAVLGWEREQAGKSAGLRTHMLVGISAALYTGLAEVATGELGAQAAPTRSGRSRRWRSASGFWAGG